MSLPTFADVEHAARQIAGVAHRTPVATSRSVNALTGAEVFRRKATTLAAGLEHDDQRDAARLALRGSSKRL